MLLEATGWTPGPGPCWAGAAFPPSSPSTWPQRSSSGSSCGAEKGRQTAPVWAVPGKQRRGRAVHRK